ncbi:Sodium- and chloride-dependent GABA transporter 1 [Teratosphaeriaceae sp. CCFEE 6253]|nr:Sodium- and chloride-dependent GABA transporter 1 [Teratosphaeriaceae sp. CCFEE 6253]
MAPRRTRRQSRAGNALGQANVEMANAEDSASPTAAGARGRRDGAAATTPAAPPPSAQIPPGMLGPAPLDFVPMPGGAATMLGGAPMLQGPLMLGPNGELPPGVHPGMLTGPQEWEWLTMSL